MKNPFCLGCLLSLVLIADGAAQAPLPDGIGSGCMETELTGCRVLSAGFTAADEDGESYIAWQTQAGFTYQNGVLGGFVLFQSDGDGWKLVDKGFDAWRYAPPVVNEEGLLHIAGYGGGTGAANADRLYRWKSEEDGGRGRWQPVGMDGWQETIGELLPEGLAIEKGVTYGFKDRWSGFVARTSLWAAGDANCCPTGGDAVIIFEIEEDSLAVVDVEILQAIGSRAR